MTILSRLIANMEEYGARNMSSKNHVLPKLEGAGPHGLLSVIKTWKDDRLHVNKTQNPRIRLIQREKR